MGVPVQVWHLPPLYVKAQISSDLSAVSVGCIFSAEAIFGGWGAWCTSWFEPSPAVEIW